MLTQRERWTNPLTQRHFAASSPRLPASRERWCGGPASAPALVPRTRSSHHNCRESECELRVQSGTRIIGWLVSYDSEVRIGTCCKIGILASPSQAQLRQHLGVDLRFADGSEHSRVETVAAIVAGDEIHPVGQHNL